MNTHKEHALEYNRNLPDFVVDLLELHGVAPRTTAAARIGFDGTQITVPVPSAKTISRFEYWDVDETGLVYVKDESIEVEPVLYGSPELVGEHFELVITQGILECLVARSHGLFAACVSGSGVAFDSEWRQALHCAKRRTVCFKHGYERDAQQVADLIDGHVVILPALCPSISAFFVDCGQSVGDFRRRSLDAYEAKRRNA